MRPDMLRGWAKQAGARTGAPAHDVFPGQGRLPSEQEELRRLQREVARLHQENEFLEKAAAYFADGVAVREKHAMIAAHRDHDDVRLMCEALGVSVSGFYAAQRRPRSARAQTDEELRVQVRAAHTKSRRRYGAPRVHEELQAQGTRVAKKRVARPMREDGLVARRRRRGVRTTDSRHHEPTAPNHLARRFAVREIAGPDHVWARDITYVPTGEGWL